MGYVERGVINFEGLEIFVDGYWERIEGKPFFDAELEKSLKTSIFKDNPKYSIHVCSVGKICEVRKDGSAYIEFEVWDKEKISPYLKVLH
jgi:hypothetical protein